MLYCFLRALVVVYCILYFFFFQAEDGIRDVAVTGVQTCALPISYFLASLAAPLKIGVVPGIFADSVEAAAKEAKKQGLDVQVVEFTDWATPNVRSEERRVGKECRSRWSPYH